MIAMTAAPKASIAVSVVAMLVTAVPVAVAVVLAAVCAVPTSVLAVVAAVFAVPMAVVRVERSETAEAIEPAKFEVVTGI